MKKIFASIIIAVLMTSCGKKEATIQQLINVDFDGKQLSFIEDKLGIRPIHIDSFGKNKAYEYQVQGCKITLYVDDFKNIVGFNFPVENSCPFEMQLGSLKFDSRKSTLKEIDSGSNGCDTYIYSNDCIGLCGNAYDPSEYNYLEISGSHACNFEYYKFQFDETPGIYKWKELVLDDVIQSNLNNSQDDDSYWYKNSTRFRNYAKKYWEDKLPVSVTNMQDPK